MRWVARRARREQSETAATYNSCSLVPRSRETSRSGEPVGGRARTWCYGFHPVTTKTGRFSDGLTQFVEGAITTAERRQ